MTQLLSDPALAMVCPQLFDLERQRQERVAQLATLIQKMFRGWRCRTQYQLMRKSQILISAWFRGHRVRTGRVLATLPLPIPLPLALRVHPAHSLLPPQQKNHYKQMKRSALILQAYARGWKVRAGHPRATNGTGLAWGAGWVGTGAPCAPRWDQGLRVSRGGTRFTLISSPRLSSFSPASLLPLPLAPCLCWCLPLGLPGLSPPQSRRLLRELKFQRRCHAAASTIAAHWRGYQVTGPRALRPPLSCCPGCLSVCPPRSCPPCRAGAAVLSAGAKWGWEDAGEVGGETPLSLVGPVVMSGVLIAGAIPAGAQDLQEVFPLQRQHLLGQLHLPAAGEWGWGRGGHGAFPDPCPGAGQPCPLLTPPAALSPPGAEVPGGAGEEPPAAVGDGPDLAPGAVPVPG